MEHYKVIQQEETATVNIRLCSDQIIRIDLKPGAEIDVNALEDMYSAFSQMTVNKSYGFIYNVKDGTSTLTFEARKFASQNNVRQQRVCVAIVIKSLAQRIIGNFYLNTVKPGVPYKLFNSLAEAEKWCEKQVSKKLDSYNSLSVL